MLCLTIAVLCRSHAQQLGPRDGRRAGREAQVRCDRREKTLAWAANHPSQGVPLAKRKARLSSGTLYCEIPNP
jgi:hypothetical protein